jgi:hypothetical protein
MRLNPTRIIIALLAVTLIYSACQKTVTNPVKTITTTNTTDQTAALGQVATDLYKSLTGQYGGTNLNEGIKIPSQITNGQPLHTLNSVSSLCGYTVDTSYTVTSTAHDTSKVTKTGFKFVYTCGSGKVNGYKVYDTITYAETNGKYTITNGVAQRYSAKALDNTFKLIQTDGGILTSSLYYIKPNTKDPRGESHSFSSQYIMTALKIDIRSGVADITSGTATFLMIKFDLDKYTAIDGTFWSAQGTITYQAGHKAKLTYNGKSYLVNLLTGVVTPL